MLMYVEDVFNAFSRYGWKWNRQAVINRIPPRRLFFQHFRSFSHLHSARRKLKVFFPYAQVEFSSPRLSLVPETSIYTRCLVRTCMWLIVSWHL